MLNVARALFVLVGIVNFAPVTGVLGAAQLQSLYGQPVADADLLLLLRHRAVLFGLLGALLICAAFRRELRTLAAIAGVVSMSAFCILAWPTAAHSAALQRVFWIDLVAIPLLIGGWWMAHRAERN